MKPTLPTLLSFNGGYVDTVGYLSLRRVLDVNLTGVFLTAREAARHLKRKGWGRLIIIPGSLTSMPYRALPSTLSATSTRTGEVPIRSNLPALSTGRSGTGSAAAAEATLPYVQVRPEGACVITLFAAAQGVAGHQ